MLRGAYDGFLMDIEARVQHDPAADQCFQFHEYPVEGGIILPRDQLCPRGAIHMHHRGMFRLHALRAAKTDGHELGCVPGRLHTVTVQFGVFRGQGGRKGHKIAARQHFVQASRDFRVYRAHEDGPVAQGAGAPFHRSAEPADNQVFCKQLRCGTFRVGQIFKRQSGLVERCRYLFVRVGLAQEYMLDWLGEIEPPGFTDGAQRQAAIAHIRIHKQLVHLLEFVEMLIQLHIRENTARHHQVPQTGAAQPVTGDIQGIFFEKFLSPGGHIRPSVTGNEMVADPGNAFASDRAGIGQHAVDQCEGRRLPHVFGHARGGQAGNFALIAAGRKAEGLG
ncbi:MAG: hypothetical protein BWY09_01894 [Candidatus Hydrogenedentes bacterium ADurb.Bin179]|nr:MAG: hypothetical protein BWY09_01894 [Candidatus Hydrogenedentes bacterium ADurb.Bin179]